jgi:TAG lipase/steryl ester hydrolase/phospholipase A2/LPA acyltransferase
MTRENPRARQALHQYMDVVCDALSLIARGARNEEDLDLQAKISALRSRTNFFSETLHSFGRSALLLSGGARLGLMHLGVVRGACVAAGRARGWVG